MKVKQLIAELQKFDPEMKVVVRGFDGEGFAKIRKPKTVGISLRKSKTERDTFGEYVKDKSKAAKEAVLIEFED